MRVHGASRPPRRPLRHFHKQDADHSQKGTNYQKEQPRSLVSLRQIMDQFGEQCCIFRAKIAFAGQLAGEKSNHRRGEDRHADAVKGNTYRLQWATGV